MMVDATTPEPGVDAVVPSVEERLSALYARKEPAPDAPERKQPEAAPEAKPEPVADEPASDELTPEDLPGDAEPNAQPDPQDAFEIVHNGTQHRLSREETIKLAQQGYDYTQKTQALAEKAKAVEALLQRTQEIEQVVPLIAQEQAQVAAIKSQLDQYAEVDWVRLATEQPLDYPRYRAQYDLLVNSYNAQAQRLNAAQAEVAKRKQEITATMLQQEAQRLRELVPEWKDPEKFKAGAEEVSSYLVKQGADPRAVAGISDALAVSIARKAMLYDKLVKSKAEKSKLLQTTPPVARPGAAQPPNAAAMEKFKQARNALKKSGDWRDAGSLLAKMK